MKFLAIIFPTMIGVSAFAQTAPPETVIKGFNSVCDRPQQVTAFSIIIKRNEGNGYGTPYHMVEVKPEYDRQDVKDAFAAFVRSMTIQRPNCSAGYQDFIESTEGDNIQTQILSLYINWGLTQDLYPITDEIPLGNDPEYGALILDKIAPGYFEYAVMRVQADSTYGMGAGLAAMYLEHYPNPSTEKKQAALSLLHAIAASAHEVQRINSVYILFTAYLAGYTQVKPDLDALKYDTSERVRKGWKFEVENEHKFHRLLEFEAGE